MSIEVLDERTIGRLPALTSSSSDRASRYVRALVGEGPSTYIENANIEMRALVMDGRVLPLVINSGLDRCAAETCSPLAHYVDYTLEEFGKRHPRVSSRTLTAGELGGKSVQAIACSESRRSSVGRSAPATAAP